MNFQVTKKFYLQAGHVCIPYKESLLHGVVGSGIIVTVYDHLKKIGGMGHFLKAEDDDKKEVTLYHARPSIYYLLKLFEKHGSRKINLEANIYGGAFNINHINYKKDLHKINISKTEKILKDKGIRIHSKDVGGKRGRKIIFNTFSGETVVAKVNQIRNSDWYPNVSSL